MPIARGLMSMERIKYYHTQTVFYYFSQEPGTAECGQATVFGIRVTNLDGGPTPVGTIQLYDLITQTVLGTASLVSGQNTITVSLSLGVYLLVGVYIGDEVETSPPVVDREFGPSATAPVAYPLSPATTSTAITTPASNYTFCSSAIVSVTATVSSLGTVNGGTVEFRLWSDDTNFVSLASGTVSSGTATTTIPSNTTTAGNSYYLEALYDGTSCFIPSHSNPGTTGLKINSSNSLSTTTTLSITDGQTVFCPYSTKQFTVTVTSSPSNPTSGTIEVWADNGDGSYPVGTGSLSGTNSGIVTVAADSFEGINYVFGVYDGDGACFGGSDSSASETFINPTTYGVTISFQSGNTSICHFTAETYVFHVSSSHSGTISGQFQLWSTGSGSALGTVTTSGSSSGFNVTFTNIFPPTGDYQIYVTFTHNTPTGCYADNFGAGYTYVNVQGSVSPGVNLVLSANSGAPYDSLTLTEYVTHNGGFTSLNAQVQFSYYDPSSVFHVLAPNQNLVDTGDPSSVSYFMSNAGPQGDGVYSFRAYYYGTNCYSAESGSYSSAQNYTAVTPPH